MLNEIIWNNKLICIGGKPLFRNKIVKKSIIKLLNDTGKLKTWNVLENENIYFLLMSVLTLTNPLEWKNILKQQFQNTHANNNNYNDIAFSASSRVLYWDIGKKIETIPT